MNNVILRKGFFNRSEFSGLASDYLYLLATTCAHPLINSAGVLSFTRVAALSVGFEHSEALTGLRELARRGLIAFNPDTLECFNPDFFAVNQMRGFLLANVMRDIEKASPLIRDFWNASKESQLKESGVLVPANLASSVIATRTGAKLMRSDALLAIACYVDDFTNSAGVGMYDPCMFSAALDVGSNVISAGFGNLQRSGLLLVDNDTGEYALTKFFKLPGKLDTQPKLSAIAQAAGEIQSKVIARDVYKRIGEVTGLKRKEVAALAQRRISVQPSIRETVQPPIRETVQPPIREAVQPPIREAVQQVTQPLPHAVAEFIDTLRAEREEDAAISLYQRGMAAAQADVVVKRVMETARTYKQREVGIAAMLSADFNKARSNLAQYLHAIAENAIKGSSSLNARAYEAERAWCAAMTERFGESAAMVYANNGFEAAAAYVFEKTGELIEPLKMF